jgi:glycosyltransferase involved in cell wall biosynthesis
MRQTIGVAIPCYKHHANLIPRCLASIEAQTVKPDAVVISCSSSCVSDIPVLPTYSFPLTLLVSSEKRNAAENRNIAAQNLRTDLISFFDVDDIMHPQRLESLGDCDITLHSFLIGDEQPFQMYSRLITFANILRRAPSGCAVLETDISAPIHHAHVTVKREILSRVQFRTDPQYARREDSLFCGDVLALPNITSLYIANPLSRYYETGATIQS